MQKDHIPTYGADGKRMRDYPLGACLRLEAAQRMLLQRNRRGEVTCAHYRQRAGGAAAVEAEPRTQSVSSVRLELLPGGRRMYWLRGLPKSWSHEPIEFPNATDLPKAA